MLRITLLEESGTTILKLEGQISGKWSNEFSNECEKWLREKGRLIVDLSGVAFIDENGVKTLKSMLTKGLGLIGCSPFVTRLLS